MKAKLSVTLEESLMRFLDGLPGESCSEKLERVLRRYKEVSEELALRRMLAAYRESEAERDEREAWVRTIEHDAWRVSAEGTSGCSSSSTSRSRGRA